MNQFIVWMSGLIVFWVSGMATGMMIEGRAWRNDCAETGRHRISNEVFYTCAPEKRP